MTGKLYSSIRLIFKGSYVKAKQPFVGLIDIICEVLDLKKATAKVENIEPAVEHENILSLFIFMLLFVLLLVLKSLA